MAHRSEAKKRSRAEGAMRWGGGQRGSLATPGAPSGEASAAQRVELALMLAMPCPRRPTPSPRGRPSLRGPSGPGAYGPPTERSGPDRTAPWRIEAKRLSLIHI
eukprot:396035-Alexandrium_andersonii.AAC.1